MAQRRLFELGNGPDKPPTPSSILPSPNSDLQSRRDVCLYKIRRYQIRSGYIFEKAVSEQDALAFPDEHDRPEVSGEVEAFGHTDNPNIMVLIPDDREIVNAALLEGITTNIAPLDRSKNRVMRATPQLTERNGLIV